MKAFRLTCYVLFTLTVLSTVAGFMSKIGGWVPQGLAVGTQPLSFLRFAAFCLLFIIALALVEIALKKGK